MSVGMKKKRKKEEKGRRKKTAVLFYSPMRTPAHTLSLSVVPRER